MATTLSAPAPKKSKNPGLELLKERIETPPAPRAKLSPELLAKVNAQRIRQGKKRGPKELALAIKVVAKSLGVSPEDVKKSLGL